MKQIGFKNFRRFSNPLTMDLGNINLLVGGNNSGKSTVVKALLLITENLRLLIKDDNYNQIIRDEDGKLLMQEYHPEFNFAPNILHDVLHIGTFERAINNDSDSDEIQLSVTYGEMFKVTVDVMKNDSAELPTAPIKQIIIDDIRCALSITINYKEQKVEWHFSQELIDLGDLRSLLRDPDINVRDYDELISTPFSVEKFDTLLKQLRSQKRIIKKDLDKPDNIRKEILHNFSEIERQIKQIKDKINLASEIDFSKGITIKESFSKVRIPIPFLINNMRINYYYHRYYYAFKIEDERQDPIDNIHQYLKKNTEYLGGLFRYLSKCIQEPNTEYIYAHAVSQNTLYPINSQNDYMSNTIQEYFRSNIKKEDEEYQFIQTWMETFNIASDFVVSPVAGCEAYTVKIGKKSTDQNNWMNLAEKGMGSIQMIVLLFKIATLIRKYKDSRRSHRDYMPVILIEEPEQNLHPSLQSKLADLFFEINKKYYIRFVIETHSEYLIRKAQVIVGDLEYKSQEEVDNKNPFKIFYFPSIGEPYDMGMAPTGNFLRNFDEGFFDVAAKLNFQVIRRERRK